MTFQGEPVRLVQLVSQVLNSFTNRSTAAALYITGVAAETFPVLSYCSSCFLFLKLYAE